MASRSRWMAVGMSTSESHDAGAAAAREALQGRSAALLVLLCTPHHDPAAVLAGVRSVSGDTPLIGCSSSEVFASSGPSGQGVVVTALGGDGFSVATAGVTGAA